MPLAAAVGAERRFVSCRAWESLPRVRVFAARKGICCAIVRQVLDDER
jgi:hypothetical protein